MKDIYFDITDLFLLSTNCLHSGYEECKGVSSHPLNQFSIYTIFKDIVFINIQNAALS